MIAIDEDFPYDLPGRLAMVALLQKTKPHLDVREGYVVFEDLRLSPIPGTPGRSFIEVDNQWTNVKSFFAFRRLDLGRALGPGNPKITVTGRITAQSIALEINRSRNRFLDDSDVDFSNVTLHNGEGTFYYHMKAKPSSFVYYGEAIIEVNAVGINPFARLLEDGTPRQLEDGTIRLLEQA